MLIKILAILNIIGIVMSIIAILIKGMNFIALGISNAIHKNPIDVEVNYKIPFVTLFISITTLTCIIVL